MGEEQINPRSLNPNADFGQNNVMDAPEPVKIGAWKGGWLLARASWSTLKLDKELALFPLITAFTTIVFLGLIGLILYLSGINLTEEPPAWLIHGGDYLLGFIIYLVIFLIASFFSGAIIASALHRFKGGDPTIRYGIGEAKKRFGSILKFSLFSATIGYILRLIEEKSGLAAKIFAYVVDVAWGIVSMFSIAVIVSKEEPVGPVQAARESAEVFKRCWAKNYMGGLGMGLAFLMIFLLWLIFSGALIAASIIFSPVTLYVTAPITALVLILMISVSSALSSIFQAALFHYATTGESPVNFEKDLLRAAFRPKKGWFA